MAPAELAVIDAFTRAAPLEDETAMQEEDAKHNIRPLPPLDPVAVVRLEDQIEPEVIASEVIGSRTLGMGSLYTVEPKELHVILEDLRGSHAFDWRDVAFEPGRVYIGIRAGCDGDSAFPERLLLHRIQEEMPS